MYNLLFTTLPVVFLGSFDRDVTLEDTERFPGLYVLGINDVFFNFKVGARGGWEREERETQTQV